MDPGNFSLDSTSLKSRFTRGFLQALKRINKQKTMTALSSPREIYTRYRRVKSAAYKSMALAVRSRRVWRRAMLWRLQRQALRRQAHGRRIRTCAMTKRGLVKKKEKKGGEETSAGRFNQANELRRLVPGGEAMDLCNLLEETAHYIKCLNTQVQVMRCIVDFYTT